MTDKAWKSYERWVASVFGTRRRPLSGSNQGSGTGDIIHDKLNIECKNHKNSTVVNWMNKTIKESDKKPLMFIHKKNTPNESSVVVMPYKEFEKIKKHYVRRASQLPLPDGRGLQSGRR
ncbi:MAG: hypothetical protein ACOC80_07045 [Petrotogales bacterium]